MDADQTQLVFVVEAILRYLDRHPEAVDTVEGITRWWLPADACVSPDIVEAALARLEAQGLVRRRANPDRHVLYSR
ncbi:MAG TPA: helix-turn-helix domain-containing protein [Thiobacillaceae bacterium]|nr:helix-turn-helix domain-containing protein [Thiobacillaceae bacterium]HNA81971.1 helix-turn-helix domain-containing protein [Thiobacillaceae bacterium]HNF88242.1 helix-turn-helix domain-containing protein [Thiobacillaceae bacterium]HNH88641.1 helix-turn-helix domain-containing protein [Thiobacillaceae bacterium]HNI07897.1 helix-turn-helix domain-containing protein [Thiobacillaceae bacterium]